MRLYLESLIEKRISDLEKEMNRRDYLDDEQLEEMQELEFFRNNIFRLSMIKEEGVQNA